MLTKSIKLEGAEWNNTLVRNVTIHDVDGYGILLRDVDNVCIVDSTVRDVSESGIRLSISGSTSNVTIAGNHIYSIGENGINAGQRVDDGVDHRNLRIVNNEVRDTGLCCTDGLHHGLYIQAQDFHIEGNRVMNSRDGNGISVRSSGVIRGNTVGYAGKSAIAYYADHMHGSSDRLVIENNIAYGNGHHGTAGRAAIDLLSIPEPRYAAHEFVMRFNTAVSLNPDLPALAVAGDYGAANYRVSAYGNLLVNIAAGPIQTGPLDRNTSNVEAMDLTGFLSPSEPYDFHIELGHAATGAASMEPEFPPRDIDGQPRLAGRVDAGADQITR